MSVLEIGPEDGLAYRFAPPRDDGITFVFVNALTGSLDMWEAHIAPALREAGHGTLTYNFRGQADSPFAPGTALTPDLAAEDLRALLDAVAPARPVLVGLSIGGLFAAQALLGGASAVGLVLINTLRKATDRLDWINAAMVKAVGTGGIPLLLDMMLPMLVNDEQLAAMRGTCLGSAAYVPLPESHGHYNLMAHAGAADWDVPYEDLDLPVLVMTGLKDRVFYDADDVSELAARIADRRLVTVEDAGHLIPLERPKRTADELKAFALALKAR